MPKSSKAAAAPNEVLEIVRTFDAPRALIFRLWSSAEHRVRWWGPEGYALSHCEVDFREGGAWSVAMQRADGYEHWVHGVFTEIREPSRLCFTYIGDLAGYDTLVTMDFADLGGRTEMRFRQEPFPTGLARDEHHGGWSSSLELLNSYAQRVHANDPQPVGRPRIDGDAPDIIAARKRQAKQDSTGD